jgi:hypothetical protein
MPTDGGSGIDSSRALRLPVQEPADCTAGSAARAEARRLDGSPSTWCCDLLVGQVEKLSPPHRGMTWKCRWGTDCSELGPLALRMLTPSAPRAERIASATRLTSAIDWARTCGAASKTSVTCTVGTTRVWPGAIGVSGAKAHVDRPRAIQVAVSSRMRRQKTQSMVPDVLRSRPGETRFSVATELMSNARISARTSACLSLVNFPGGCRPTGDLRQRRCREATHSARGDDSQPFGIINKNYTPDERVSFRCYEQDAKSAEKYITVGRF